MAVSQTGWAFAASVIAGSVATVCLPGLTGLVAAQADKDDVGATLAALDSMSTLDRFVAYKVMSRLFAWGIAHGQVGTHFYAGAGCALLGWVAFEVALCTAPRTRRGVAPEVCA